VDSSHSRVSTAVSPYILLSSPALHCVFAFVGVQNKILFDETYILFHNIWFPGFLWYRNVRVRRKCQFEWGQRYKSLRYYNKYRSTELKTIHLMILILLSSSVPLLSILFPLPFILDLKRLEAISQPHLQVPFPLRALYAISRRVERVYVVRHHNYFTLFFYVSLVLT
jgi:hypothetical protein